MRRRFMSGKSEKSSELIGNQDLESAFASGIWTELTRSSHLAFNISAQRSEKIKSLARTLLVILSEA
jgi:hypothetical protein